MMVAADHQFYKGVWGGMIIQALIDVQEDIANYGVEFAPRCEAARWINGGTDSALPFDSLCDALTLDAKSIRAKMYEPQSYALNLEEQRPKQHKASRLRTIVESLSGPSGGMALRVSPSDYEFIKAARPFAKALGITFRDFKAQQSQRTALHLGNRIIKRYVGQPDIIAEVTA